MSLTGATTAITAAGGSNIYNVGDTLSAIANGLSFTGDGGDTLNLNDTGDPGVTTGQMTATNVTGLSPGSEGIAYSQIGTAAGATARPRR